VAQEAEAARTIAQRGVVLVGTAHGIELGGLLKNPDLVRLVGGVTPVTLGDAQAAASNQGRKVRRLLLGSRTGANCC
jgi:stage III sporulation protein SpoIIIAA